MAIDWGKIFDAAGQIGQVAGATAGGRAQGRQAEAGININAFDAKNNAVAADLAKKRYLGAAPSAFASQSLMSDILGNAGRIKLNVPNVTGHAEGGLSPDLIGANSKAAAKSLGEIAAQRMAELPRSLASTGGPSTGGVDSSRPGGFFDNAEVPMPKEGLMDKILGGVGTFGAIAGAAKGLLPSGVKTAASLAPGLTQIGGKLVPIGDAAAKTATAATKAGGIGSKIKAGGIGGILGGAQTAYDISRGNVTGATLNGAMTGFKYGGPIGAGVGAAVGAVGASIRKNMNITKGGREEFAKKQGFGSLHEFNQYLDTLGPAGQEAKHYGENVVGKHNTEQQNNWFALAQEAIDRAGGTGRAPIVAKKPFGGK